MMGVVAIHYSVHDSILESRGKFTNNTYNHSNKLVNIMKA